MVKDTKLKILDCTLRDGGYYTNWDFNQKVIDAYIGAMNQLPIDYLEVGYRNNLSTGYLGKLGYTPVSVLKRIRENSNKKIAVMLNEKSTLPKDLDKLLKPIQGMADMIRIAINPDNIDRAIVLAKSVKSYGFEVGFNVMYMSTWLQNESFIKKLKNINGVADLFCMVDSYGGVTPSEVKEIISLVRKNTNVPIGFHGHNNLELGLVNTLTAIEEDVDFVDATILGMGRGAGNLKMELLLTYLNKEGLDVDFNVLGDAVSTIQPLLDKYQWGTQLPYMLSGANSIPQKEVMALVTNRTYSFNSIVRGLQNRKNNIVDNAKYPVLHAPKYDTVVIIGGGESPVEHFEGIRDFIQTRNSIAIVFATARHASVYNDIDIPKYYCLIGREAKRLSANLSSDDFNGECVLPPYPRKLGTEVPDYAKGNTSELVSIDFTGNYQDSCTAIALQIAINMHSSEIYLVGYDGYPGAVLSEKEVALTNENMMLFANFEKATGRRLKSLTPTLYPELKVESVYQFI